MERHLNLVESDFERLEKKVFPRFPFCFLTFKTFEDGAFTYEVKDISHSGMQLALRMGEHQVKTGDTVSGQLHWNGQDLNVSGVVRWATHMRAGIEFNPSQSLRESISNLLDLAAFGSRLKPVHQMDIELPARLKYWLRSDGPVELFVWQHGDGEIAKFEIVMMENFVEWEDTKGLKTARVISKRDIDTPLITEDEFVFQIDSNIDDNKISKAARLVNHIAPALMDNSVVQFITLKLRA